MNEEVLLWGSVPLGINIALALLWWGAREPFARISIPVDTMYATVLLNVALLAWLTWALFT